MFWSRGTRVGPPGEFHISRVTDNQPGGSSDSAFIWLDSCASGGGGGLVALFFSVIQQVVNDRPNCQSNLRMAVQPGREMCIYNVKEAEWTLCKSSCESSPRRDEERSPHLCDCCTPDRLVMTFAAATSFSCADENGNKNDEGQ